MTSTISPLPLPAPVNPPVFPMANSFDTRHSPSDLEKTLLQGIKLNMRKESEKRFEAWYMWLGYDKEFIFYAWKFRSEDFEQYSASNIVSIRRKVDEDNNIVFIEMRDKNRLYIKTEDAMDMDELYFLLLKTANVPGDGFSDVDENKIISNSMSLDSIHLSEFRRKNFSGKPYYSDNMDMEEACNLARSLLQNEPTTTTLTENTNENNITIPSNSNNNSNNSSDENNSDQAKNFMKLRRGHFRNVSLDAQKRGAVGNNSSRNNSENTDV